MSQLYLNTVPFGLINKNKIKVFNLDFTDRETLNSIRLTLRDTHFVRRNAHKIEIVPYNISDELHSKLSNASQSEIDLTIRTDLLDSLVENWLFRSLKNKGLTCWKDSQVHYLSKKNESELLSQCSQNFQKLPKTVAVRIGADFSVRRIKLAESETPVITINIQKRIIINEPISELIYRGFEVKGLYVLEKRHAGEKGVLVGKVIGIDDGLLYLDDYGNYDDTLDSKKAYLEPRYENLEKVLQFYLGAEASKVLENLKLISSQKLSGPSKLELVEQLAGFIYKQPNNIAQEVGIEIRTMLSSINPPFITNQIYDKPTLLFDVSGRKTNTWNQGGLDRFGPFNWERFPYKKINIAMVCQGDKQGEVEQFLNKFLKGIPGDRYAETGFLKRYHFDKPYVRIFTTAGTSSKDYKIACGEAIEHITEHERKWHLVFVQIEESFHLLKGDENPYLVSKAYLLSKDIAVQQFEIETINQVGFSLVASINNMGVACYAKMGGIPWVLPVNNTISHELIFGIGSYTSTDGRLGERKRFVGVTTVFSGDGRYLLESRTAAVDYESYQKELSSTLIRVVNDVKRTEAWDNNDPVRFIFHIFKALKNKEVDAVKELVSGLGLSHVEFAFMHIVDNHPYNIFDKEQLGIGNRYKKGIFAPLRGTYLKINANESLTCLTGAKELKQTTDGLPKPILIRLHESSTFRDLDYLSRQVFDFSCLSWRGMQPSPAPITILYSDLVARNIRELSTVSGWSTENILGPIGRTRWFL